jgi:hypothetical protein
MILYFGLCGWMSYPFLTSGRPKVPTDDGTGFVEGQLRHFDLKMFFF